MNLDTVTDLQDFLFGRINYEQVPGGRMSSPGFRFNTIRELLKRLDNPHLAFPIIHVAGTKGKGSVCHSMSSIAREAGLHVGLYSSPHLASVEERFQICGQPIESSEMNRLLREIRVVVEDLDELAEHEEHFHRPTFFEITTALAFLHFADREIDLGIIEVGMGGRLDSTNVCQSQVCVITNISFDHTAQLGNTLESIATEKAGIVKPGVPVVCGVTDPGAQKTIHEIADAKRAPIAQVGRDFCLTQIADQAELFPKFGISGNVFGHSIELSNLQSGLAGEHQSENAALAVAALTAAQDLGISIGSDTMQRGLAKTSIPGRYQRWTADRLPPLRLDIAHNEASMAALGKTLRSDPDYQSAQRRILVYSVCRGKHNTEMLQQILPLFEQVVFTEFRLNPRAVSAEKLVSKAEEINPQVATSIVADADQIATWIKHHCQTDDFVCITGSNFLVAEVLPTLEHLS